MSLRPIYTNYVVSFLFLVIGLLIIGITINYPIGDFGNYYYGSKLFSEGKFSVLDYQSIQHFNQQISTYGQHNYFENYTPVPPFSILFYLPFIFLNSIVAKITFNTICLILFCISLFRLLNFCSAKSWKFYLLPLIFLYPLYNCIIQGQSYLLITSLLIETFLADENKKYVLSALYICLCVCLKIFPVFILLYFILKNKSRVVIYAISMVSVCLLLTVSIIGFDILKYYINTVLPRLINNDIIGPYYHGNQSIYTLLLNLFSFDTIQNKHPIFNFPIIIPIIEGVITSVLLIFLIVSRKKLSILFFGFVLFCSLIIGRYNTTYSMLILVPFVVAFISERKFSSKEFFMIGILMISLSMPIGYFIYSGLVLQFSRLIGLVVVFSYMIIIYRGEYSMKLIMMIGIPVIFIKYISFPIKPISYFETQNTKGIMYDYELKNDSIILKSTIGNNNMSDAFHIKGKINVNQSVYIKENIIFYDNEPICTTTDNKSKPFIFNDTSIVFMSDLNQGIGFNKLRFINFTPR